MNATHYVLIFDGLIALAILVVINRKPKGKV